MREASLKDSGGFGRYLAFVAGGIAVPILAVSVLSSGGRVDAFVEMVGILVTFGVVGWGPVALLAIVPGWWLFRSLRRVLRGTRVVNLAGTALAAVAVAGVGALGAAVPTLLLPEGPDGGLPVRTAIVFAWGAPGAVLAGLAVYAKEDLTGG